MSEIPDEYSGFEPDIDKLLQDLTNPTDEWEALYDKYGTMEIVTKDFEQRKDVVMNRLRELHPNLDIDAFVQDMERLHGEGGSDVTVFDRELDIMMFNLTESQNSDEHLSFRLKLHEAMMIIRVYEPELQPTLLCLVDAIDPLGQTVGQLSADEIRRLNLLVNGEHEGRQEFYKQFEDFFADNCRSVVTALVETLHGTHDGMEHVVQTLLAAGVQLGAAEWERDHTADTPEDRRAFNYQVVEMQVEASLAIDGPETVLGKEGAKQALELVVRSTLNVLETIDGPHKQ